MVGVAVEMVEIVGTAGGEWEMVGGWENRRKADSDLGDEDADNEKGRG